MSEERVIRISKVLKEFNISLDRAVDTLKEKGHSIEHSPNAKVSQVEFDVLCDIFSADKGNKVASKEVGEEKKKEKEALKREIEKELEVKRLAEEERQKQEVIKARAVVTAPVTLGKIDLNPKKQEQPKVEKPVVAEEKPAVVQENNVVAKEEKPVVADKPSDKPAEPVKKSFEKPKEAPAKAEEPSIQPQEFNADGTPIEVKLIHNIQSFQEQLLLVKRLIYLNLINLRKRKKSLKNQVHLELQTNQVRQELPEREPQPINVKELSNQELQIQEEQVEIHKAVVKAVS